jgi:uncharacterized protein YigE (DUF2233 family)
MLGLISVFLGMSVLSVEDSERSPAYLARRQSFGGWDPTRYGASSLSSVISHLGTDYLVATVDPKRMWIDLFGQEHSTLRNFDNIKTFVAQQGRRLLWAQNSALFHYVNTPVGLHIERGISYHPLESGTGTGNFYILPNGVFSVGENGDVRITETSQFWTPAARLWLALQSGPLLLVSGAINSAFNKNSTNFAIRSSVGVTSSGMVHLVLSLAPVRFYDIASLHKDILSDESALFLDGAICDVWTESRTPTRKGPFAGVLTVSVPA